MTDLSLTKTPAVVRGATNPGKADVQLLEEELLGGINTNIADIATNATAITGEATARASGDATNATAITGEATARASGDETNATAITDAVALARSINNTWVTLFISDGVIEWDDTANTVTFPRLRREEAGASSVNGATSQGPFAVSMTTDVFYYIMDNAGVITQVNALAGSNDESATSKTIGLSSTGELTLHWSLPKPIKTSETVAAAAITSGIAARPTAEPITARENVFFAQESNPMMLPHFADVYEISGTNRFFVDAPIDGMAYAVPSGGTVYLNMHPGKYVTLTSTGSFTMYAGDGRKFSGGDEDDNQCVVTKPTNGSASVRVSRDAGARMNIENASHGTTLTFSTIAETAPAEHIFVFGQSHGNSLFNAGLSGFQRAIDRGTFAITDSFINFSNGSVGGTGVAYPDGVSFWNTTDDIPGALLNTAMDALDDKTDVDGWPRASAFIFECGDADRAAFSTDEMTVAELAVVVGQVLDEVRDHCLLDVSSEPIAECIMGIYGATRPTDPDTGTTAETSATASRQAYLQAAAARSWVTVVECKAPRGRVLNNVHLNDVGAYRHTFEIGCAFARAVHGVTAVRYATVTSAVKQSTRVLRVTYAAPAGEELVLPLPKFNGVQLGPYPFGSGIIGSGGNASTDSLTIESAAIASATAIDFTVIDGEDVTGGTFITHAGHLEDAMFGNFVKTNGVDATSGRGVQPALVAVTT